MQILQFPDSSWGLTVLKNIFLRFIGLKGLKMVWKKSSLIWNFFPWFWLKNPFFPDFPDWKKSSKFSLNSLIGGNPAPPPVCAILGIIVSHPETKWFECRNEVQVSSIAWSLDHFYTGSMSLFLPPANEVWGKAIFLHLSVILFTVGEYLGRYPPPPGRYTPLPQAGTPPGQVHPPGSSACWEIRATSGRYASYWNAFLFYIWHMGCNNLDLDRSTPKQRMRSSRMRTACSLPDGGGDLCPWGSSWQRPPSWTETQNDTQV